MLTCNAVSAAMRADLSVSIVVTTSVKLSTTLASKLLKISAICVCKFASALVLAVRSATILACKLLSALVLAVISALRLVCNDNSAEVARVASALMLVCKLASTAILAVVSSAILDCNDCSAVEALVTSELKLVCTAAIKILRFAAKAGSLSILNEISSSVSSPGTTLPVS